jgi:hypothetical protein
MDGATHILKGQELQGRLEGRRGRGAEVGGEGVGGQEWGAGEEKKVRAGRRGRRGGWSKGVISSTILQDISRHKKKPQKVARGEVSIDNSQEKVVRDRNERSGLVASGYSASIMVTTSSMLPRSKTFAPVWILHQVCIEPCQVYFSF